LGAVAFLQFAVLQILTHFNKKLEEDFGAKSPDTHFGYNEREFYEILDKWGVEGCNVYLNVAIYDFLYIPLYSTFLGSILYRSCQKHNWDTKVATQLAVAMMVSDYGETIIHYMACMSYPAERLTPTLLFAGDLCSKVKTVSVMVAVILIITIVIIKAYIWPLLLLNGGTKKKEGKSSKVASAKKDK
jgi:hypothetical protein